MTAYCFVWLTALPIVQHGLRRRFAHFKPCAHFLHTCSKRLNLLLLARDDCSSLLHCLVFFEKLVEQWCRSKGGLPFEKGFWTWLRNRNRNGATRLKIVR